MHIFISILGNPFFVLQFLKTIHNEGMLRFDTASQTWFWDLENIQTICSTSNVVEFMVQTLSKLDVATQNVMAHAACLGRGGGGEGSLGGGECNVGIHKPKGI